VAYRPLVYALFVYWGCFCCLPIHAQSMDRRISGLFGGTFSTSITPRDITDAQSPRIAERFRKLSAALAAARSQAPIPSASGAFRFLWDSKFDNFVRVDEGLGSSLAERARTLGAHVGILSASYTHVDFDTLDGDRLNRLRAVQPSLSQGFLDSLPSDDRQRASDDLIETRLNLSFGLDLFFLTAAYGVTDSIDVSAALAINRARMRAGALAVIQDPHGDDGSFFTLQQPGVIIGSAEPECSIDFRCAEDGFSASSFGTGDLFLRAKWHAGDTVFADFAAVGVLTIPTGNADNFLGFHNPTFTPWLIASKRWGPLSPHLNLGYAFRGGSDAPGQAEWIAGADLRTFEWLTLDADFLGFHDDVRGGSNVIQSAVGFRMNPFGQTVIGATFQFPLNRDGLRADVIYSAQIEYTF